MATLSPLQKDISLHKPAKQPLTKLESTIITGEGVYPMDEEEILRSISDLVGIYHSVNILIKKGTQVSVHIDANDEIMEKEGMRQLKVFNVQKMLCLKFGVRVFHVENSYVPEYA